MRTAAIVLVSFLWAAPAVAQHFPLQSFYPFHSAIINPAMSGYEGHFNITGSHRSQWIGLEGAPVTDIITAHGPLVNPRYALGGSLVADRIGVTNQLFAMAHYAYRVPLAKGRLCFGLTGGAGALQSAYETVGTTQPDDPVFLPAENLVAPVAGTGIFYYTKKLGVGFSLPLIISPQKMDTGSETYEWFFHAMYKVQLGEKSYLQPLAILRGVSQVAGQADLGVRFNFASRLGIGLIYRTESAITGLLEVSPTANIRIGYAYDSSYQLPGIRARSGHEIMVRVDLRRTVRSADPRFF